MRLLALLLAAGACGRVGFDARGDGGAGDDAPSADAVDASITPANIAFVTSTEQVIGTIGGTAAADAICNTRATAAGLPGTYVAWVSSPTSNARDRIGTTARGWRRRDGLPFADTLADIAVNRWFYPIEIDENGNTVASGNAATATIWDGTYLSTQGDCSGLTSTTGFINGGSPSSGANYWTTGSGLSCGSSAHLYCFGTTENVAVAPTPPVTVRRAFVTDGAWSPTDGQAGADAVCQSEATAIGLGARTFLALLGTNGNAPIIRFNLSGPPWARLDDALLARTASELTTLGTLTSFNQTPTRYYQGFNYAWLGSSSLTVAGSMATTCSGWSNTSGMADISGVPGIGMFALSGTPTSCNTPAPLFCLEQ